MLCWHAIFLAIFFLIADGFLKTKNFIILTFYCVQWKLHWQHLRILYTKHPQLQKIQVQMVDGMQGYQAPCIFFDIIAMQSLGFIRLKNYVNVACTHAEDALVAVVDVVGLIAHKKSTRINILPPCLTTSVIRGGSSNWKMPKKIWSI